MVPDKASVVAQMAADIYAHDKTMSYTAAVDHAVALYERAIYLVRVSGPTSAEHPPCKYGNHLFDCAMTDCPRHGNG